MKTIKSFITKIHEIENQSLSDLNGFDSLSKEEKKGLYDIIGTIGNILGDELNKFDRRNK